MLTQTIRPQIYVACLAAYNNGYLHGKWIDANQSEEAIRDQVKAMIADSPCEDAEEWAIHDYSDFAGLKIEEWDSFEHVSELARMLCEGNDPKVMAELYEHLGSGTTAQDVIDFYNDNFAGEYNSLEEWAENFLEETGALDNVSKQLRYYIDFEKYARDADMSGDIIVIGNCVFWNH